MFVAISSQIQVQVLIGWFGSSILIFVVFMPIWTSWLGLDRIINVFVCAVSKVSDRRHLSERYGKEQEIKSATTCISYDDSNIDDKEQVRDIGIMMSNPATFTLHIRNIVRDKM